MVIKVIVISNNILKINLQQHINAPQNFCKKIYIVIVTRIIVMIFMLFGNNHKSFERLTYMYFVLEHAEKFSK